MSTGRRFPAGAASHFRAVDIQGESVIGYAKKDCPDAFAVGGKVDHFAKVCQSFWLVAGLRAGERRAAAQGYQVTTGLIVSAMRHLDRVGEVADALVARQGSGVVGFDLAGPEAGFPASRHAAALARLRSAGVPLTLHAGEGDGGIRVAEHDAIGRTQQGLLPSPEGIHYPRQRLPGFYIHPKIWKFNSINFADKLFCKIVNTNFCYSFLIYA